MKVKTTRFGEIEVDDTKIIEMRRDILGFEGLKSFTIISQEDKAPFMWLQSLENGSLAFIVVNPQLIKPDYEPEIEDQDAESLHLQKTEDAMILAIVTVRLNPFSVTANLRAPVVINKTMRIARQIVLENSDYPIRYELENKEENNGANTSRK
ncbi:MAG: flagellar assembly protein FliW [Smithellaceae bacterium]